MLLSLLLNIGEELLRLLLSFSYFCAGSFHLSDARENTLSTHAATHAIATQATFYRRLSVNTFLPFLILDLSFPLNSNWYYTIFTVLDCATILRRAKMRRLFAPHNGHQNGSYWPVAVVAAVAMLVAVDLNLMLA